MNTYRRGEKSLEAARRMIDHIRYCFLALFNGEVVAGRGEATYWASLCSGNLRYWKYPIITPDVLQDCSTLGISLSDRILHSRGVFQLTELLAVAEEAVRSIVANAGKHERVVSVRRDFHASVYRDTKTRRIPGILEPIRNAGPTGVSLYLHGSMADLRYTGFSDVDDLVVVKREAWLDALALRKTVELFVRAAREYQNVDALQHHGHWLVTELDLTLCDQSYFPLGLIADAVRVVGDSELAYRSTSDYSGFVRNVKLTVESVLGRLEAARSKGGIRAFDLKCLVGAISILPAYVLQTQGREISKAGAIKCAADMYSEGAMNALAWATWIRDESAPVVYHRPGRHVKTLAKLILARRHHVQALFRICSCWIPNDHAMGISAALDMSIRMFLKESVQLVY